MYELLYTSVAVKHYNEAELRQLLHKAQSNNEQLGITGVLLYHDGKFIQLLEGEEETVKALFASISQDPSHTSVFTFHEGEKAQRHFSEWSMHLHKLSEDEAKQVFQDHSKDTLNSGTRLLAFLNQKL